MQNNKIITLILDEMQKQIEKDLSEKFQNVHPKVLKDVSKRITDWLASGGQENDEYIQRQIQYLKKLSQMKRDWICKQR